jgi:hypothetical protein
MSEIHEPVVEQLSPKVVEELNIIYARLNTLAQALNQLAVTFNGHKHGVDGAAVVSTAAVTPQVRFAKDPKRG